MHLLHLVQSLLQFIFVVSSTVIPRDTIDPDNPEASNPKETPKTFTAPARPENPFKGGFATAPGSCTDFQKPSQQCIADLQAQPGGVVAFSGGELKWDKDHRCSNEQMAHFQTAAWDAHALAAFADVEPDEHNAKDVALWKAWMGPDYPKQQKRISGMTAFTLPFDGLTNTTDNLKRASDFLAKKSFDIIVSCKDSKDTCSLKRDGKAVGGYAWTYRGWFGQYQYIVMCDPFFQSDDLMYKIDQVEDALRQGDPKMARQADWQKNSGQIFLHEMMHLDAIGQPHIVDERVQEDNQGPWAYGPSRTHMLARRSLNQGGGASRASTNADSYAWLANSKYFYELTGYWPQPPNWKNDDMNSFDVTDIGTMTINYGTITETTSDKEILQRLNSFLSDAESSASKPIAGRALSIGMITQISSHFGGANANNEWHFFTTPVGRAVGCDWKSSLVQEISPGGPSEINLPSSTDSKNMPWPGGEYKLNIDGIECVYKCDGTNPGRLFCPNKEIACREDSEKSKSEGMLKCSAYSFFHPAVFCDF